MTTIVKISMVQWYNSNNYKPNLITNYLIKSLVVALTNKRKQVQVKFYIFKKKST